MKEVPTPPAARRRILLVDDHPLYREGMKQLLNNERDLICCGEADSCPSGHQAACALKPDLIVLDLRLRNEDGMELLRSLNTLDPPPRVIVVSQKEETVHASATLRAGALGYLMKNEATDRLLEAIRVVLEGKLYVSQRLTSLILQHSLHAGWGERGVAQWLGDRELQVFECLGAGLSHSQIAEQMHISVRTVEAHIQHIKAKLEIPYSPNLVQAARDWREESERSKRGP